MHPLDGRLRRWIHDRSGQPTGHAPGDLPRSGLARPRPWRGDEIRLVSAPAWDLFPLDHETFPAVQLAYQVGRAGGSGPAVYNAANEVCVRAFLGHQLSWLGIVDTVARVVADLGDPAAGTLEDVLAADTGRERDRTNSSPETGATRAPLNIQTMFAPTGAHRGALATAQTHRTVRGAAVVHRARGASPTTCVPKLV